MDGSHVASRAGVEGFIERAVVAEARDAIHVGVDDAVEKPADQYLAVALHGNGADGGVGADAWIEGRIQQAIGKDAGHAVARDFVELREITGHHEPAVGLPGGVLRSDGVNRTVRCGVIPEADVEIARRFTE